MRARPRACCAPADESRNAAPVGHAARGDRRVRLRRLHRRRAPRRGEGAREGAHLLASATSSASGTRRTSGPSCGTSTTRACTPASTCACSRSATGPSSTCGSTSRASGSRVPSIYFAHERPVVRRARPAGAGDAADAAARRRARRARVGALSHRRRHHLHLPGGESEAATVEAIIAETAATTITERGATRLDDQTSDASMERRKKEGYF